MQFRAGYGPQRSAGPSLPHLSHLAGLLRSHRRLLGSRWRKLSADRQALLVLALLRNGDTYARLAAGFGIGVATVCRYVREAVDLLAARAPSLTAALWRLAHNGHHLGLLDGTLVPIDRLRAKDRLYFCGKHRRHGVNLQAQVGKGSVITIMSRLSDSTGIAVSPASLSSRNLWISVNTYL